MDFAYKRTCNTCLFSVKSKQWSGEKKNTVEDC